MWCYDPLGPVPEPLVDRTALSRDPDGRLRHLCQGHPLPLWQSNLNYLPRLLFSPPRAKLDQAELRAVTVDTGHQITGQLDLGPPLGLLVVLPEAVSFLLELAVGLLLDVVIRKPGDRAVDRRTVHR